MKIVHLNTFDKGGAGIAAYRLHEGLLKEGIESSFLSFGTNEPSKRKFDYYSSLNKLQYLYFKFIDNFSARRKNTDKANREIQEIEKNVELYTSPYSKFHLEKHPLVQQADIVHLHWLPGFVDIPSFFHKLKKPIVWTLHDMNPFLGGFHYSNDRALNLNLKEIEERFIEVKKNAINSYSGEISVVCPSAWLANEATDNGIFKKEKINVIPNGIEIDQQKKDKLASKTEFSVPVDKTTFVFLADSISNKRKGFDLLLEALQMIDEENICLITIGKCGELPPIKAEVKHMGAIYEKDKLFKLISAADALIIPSREDNLPNVMLESFTCGTPVIAFAVGGLADHVNETTGMLVKELSASSLAKSISEFVQRKSSYDREKIIEYAENFFLLSTIVKKYIDVYSKLIH